MSHPVKNLGQLNDLVTHEYGFTVTLVPCDPNLRSENRFLLHSYSRSCPSSGCGTLGKKEQGQEAVGDPGTTCLPQASSHKWSHSVLSPGRRVVKVCSQLTLDISHDIFKHRFCIPNSICLRSRKNESVIFGCGPSLHLWCHC